LNRRFIRHRRFGLLNKKKDGSARMKNEKKSARLASAQNG
jgi:hypothetical protein